MSADDHGSASTYQNHGCRCPACTAAHAARVAKRRAQRYAERVVVSIDGHPTLVSPYAEHGLASSFENHGCRCPECREAVRLTARARRAAQARA